MNQLSEKALKKFWSSVFDIDELTVSLENISTDDKKEIKSYSITEVVKEAEYVLGLFQDAIGAHWNYEDLQGENGIEQQKWAKGEVKKLKALITKYK
jgi:hypothetical protein